MSGTCSRLIDKMSTDSSECWQDEYKVTQILDEGEGAVTLVPGLREECLVHTWYTGCTSHRLTAWQHLEKTAETCLKKSKIPQGHTCSRPHAAQSQDRRLFETMHIQSGPVMSLQALMLNEQ